MKQEAKEQTVYLFHILDAIHRINKYVEGIGYEDFEKNELIRDAVIRNIEIIGEATKNLLPSFTSKYPAVPWRRLAGMRDKVIHVYAAIDYKLVWETIQSDIPNLENEIRTILRKNNANNPSQK